MDESWRRSLYIELFVDVPSRTDWFFILYIMIILSYLVTLNLAEFIKPTEIMLSTFSMVIVSAFIVLLAAFLGVYTLILPRVFDSTTPPPSPPVTVQPVPRIPTDELPPPVNQPFRYDYDLLQTLQKLKNPIMILTSINIFMAIILAYLNRPLGTGYAYESTFLCTVTIGFSILAGWFFVRLIRDLAQIAENFLRGRRL